MRKIRIRRLPFLWVGLSLIAGLLLGRLVVGGWLGPAKCAEATAQDLNPEQQKKFVELVADDYARTGDLSRAQELLAGWDEGALTNLLGAMQSQALDPGLAQQLGSLGQALKLPVEEKAMVQPEPLMDSLLGEKTIVWSLALPGAMLVVAIVLVISPHIWKVRPKGTAKRQFSAGQVQELWGPQEAQAERSEVEVIMPAQEAAEGQAQPQVVQTSPAQTAQAQQTPQGKPGEGKEPQAKTVSLSSDVTVQNIVASVFAEEIIDPYLEALSKSLGDVNIFDLSKDCREVAIRLQWSISAMAKGEPIYDAPMRLDGASGRELPPLGRRALAAFPLQEQPSGA